ncbi:MAG TPA: hypothetical protein VIY26_13245 [Acidimicrobiales bacterium]
MTVVTRTTASDRVAEADDRFATARGVADAVLYEGYVLYPYRASSAKNQVRFQWGVLMPPAYCEVDPSERCSSRTECLLAPGAGPAAGEPVLHVRVRCLQTQRRRVEAVTDEGRGPAGADGFRRVESLEVDGARHVEWDEALDRVVDLPPLDLGAAGVTQVARAFSLAGGSEIEELTAGSGEVVGRFVRERVAVDGTVRVTVAPAGDGSPYLKVTVTVENETAWDDHDTARPDAMASSLVAVHTMLAADGATFVSLLDPPDEAAEAARTCRSDGTYPVVVGDETVVLSSPIILYDHPEVAEQSPGDLFDATEIDEILALRVMTLTDAEKAEARGTDARSAAIIDRCDTLSAEAMGRLHGQMRPVEPAWPTLTTPADAEAEAEAGAEAAPWWDPAADASVDPWRDTVAVDGIELGQGSRVRLRPSGRSDAQDMFLDGRDATVTGVFADVDGGFHLAVTLDDDPAAGELVWQGRYLYFHPEEVEPLPPQTDAGEPA